MGEILRFTPTKATQRVKLQANENPNQAAPAERGGSEGAQPPQQTPPSHFTKPYPHAGI